MFTGSALHWSYLKRLWEYNHTDQHEPHTPYVLNTPDQIFHRRNGCGASIFIFMDLTNLDRNVDLQQCQAE